MSFLMLILLDLRPLNGVVLMADLEDPEADNQILRYAEDLCDCLSALQSCFMLFLISFATNATYKPKSLVFSQGQNSYNEVTMIIRQCRYSPMKQRMKQTSTLTATSIGMITSW